MFGLLQSTGESFWDQFVSMGGLFDNPAMSWACIAIVMLILEIFTTGFFLGALAVSAGVTALVSMLGWGSQIQVMVFSGVSIASLIWVRPMFVNWISPDDVPTNANALVGEHGTVTAQVPLGGVGRVKLANEEWRATASEGLQVGDTVRVVDVKGNTLAVARR